MSGVVKTRHIDRPNGPMILVHEFIKDYLRRLYLEFPYATAYQPGASPLNNVKRHRKSRFFWLLDLRHAYQNVDMKKLANILCKLDPRHASHEEEMLVFLQKYCMSAIGGLAVGAPASPHLFNIYCGTELDQAIAAICEKKGLVYSRYGDDITISSPVRPVGQRVRQQIRQIIVASGFRVNDGKVELIDLARMKTQSLVINGVGLELGGRIFIPPQFVTRLRGLLHKGLRDLSLLHDIQGAMSVFLGLCNRAQPTATEQKILGMYQRFRELVRRAKRRRERRWA